MVVVMRLSDVGKLWRYRRRGRAAVAAARAAGLPSMELDAFGRELGWKLYRRGVKAGLGLYASPISCVRYYEFGFVCDNLPEEGDRVQRWLDVSSPRLMSMYQASRRRRTAIRMINPDGSDVEMTRRLSGPLGVLVEGGERGDGGQGDLPGLRVEHTDALAALSDGRAYDCVYSISVIEHIAGAYDDRAAVRAMWEAVAPGGVLILTFPVAREFFEDYRAGDAYGTQPRNERGEHFFQRFYDGAAIRQRVIDVVGQEPRSQRWFGEVEAGWFAGYERRWIAGGLEVTVDDAALMAAQFREYLRQEDMPGLGVCGLSFVRGK